MSEARGDDGGEGRATATPSTARSQQSPERHHHIWIHQISTWRPDALCALPLTRSYEWWLMNEAKKRNPDIKLYGLSWAFPDWVTCSPGTLLNCSTSNDPYGYPDQLASYITKWVTGAQNTYGLEIDYIGSWNEVRDLCAAAGSMRIKLHVCSTSANVLLASSVCSATTTPHTSRRCGGTWTPRATPTPRSSRPMAAGTLPTTF